MKKTNIADSNSNSNSTDNKTTDHFRILVAQCIEAYKTLYNDKLALDYIKVTGKLRAMVLDDTEYIQETRSAYAKRMMDEVKEIDQFIEFSKQEDIEDYDPRNAFNSNTSKPKSDKDFAAMKFKALQARREILNLTASSEAKDESEAVNLFVVNVTREELSKAIEAELYTGSADSDDALKNTDNNLKNNDNTLNNTVKNTVKNVLKDTDNTIYILDENGAVVDVAEKV